MNYQSTNDQFHALRSPFLDMLRLSLATLLALSVWTLAAIAQTPSPLSGKLFGTGNRALVVVMHGDVSRGGPADYHYRIAEQIARQNTGVTVLALLRPGYNDRAGNRSPGSHNNRRDHYTKTNNALVAQTIQNMAKQVGTSKVIAIGHSGGAAQLGSIIGLYPGLVDSSILVSCPCNIPEWRSRKGRSAWSNSQSPHDFIGKISRGTRVIVLVGANDGNTFPDISEKYAATVRARGLAVGFARIKGAGHSFSGLQSAVLQVTNSEIAN